MGLRKRMGLAAVVGMVGIAARPVPAGADDVSLEALSRDLADALDQSCVDAASWERALADPHTLLDLGGVALPDGITLDTFRLDERLVEPPSPAIELTHCRSVWVCDAPEVGKPCVVSRQQLCLGFRVVDTREVFGPIPPR